MRAEKKKRLGMVINTRRCLDCKACMVACKEENDLPVGLWRNWVRDDSKGTSRRTQFQPGQCMQCDDPSCVAACPVGATWKRAVPGRIRRGRSALRARSSLRRCQGRSRWRKWRSARTGCSRA